MDWSSVQPAEIPGELVSRTPRAQDLERALREAREDVRVLSAAITRILAAVRDAHDAQRATSDANGRIVQGLGDTLGLAHARLSAHARVLLAPPPKEEDA